LRGWWG